MLRMALVARLAHQRSLEPRFAAVLAPEAVEFVIALARGSRRR
jgi:hypothetical protein